MSTIALVVITVIGIAVIVIFVMSVGQSGKTSAGDQLSIGSNATDVVNCKLWASGMIKTFECDKIQCTKSALCDACKNYGQDEAGSWIVDSKNCLKPDGFPGCDNCPK